MKKITLSHSQNFNYDPNSFREKMKEVIKENKVSFNCRAKKDLLRGLTRSDWLSHGIGWHWTK